MEENEKIINAADGYREAFQLLTQTEIKIKFGEASEAEKKQHDSQVRGRNNSEAKLKQEAGSDQVFEELKAKAEAEAVSNLIETFKKTLEAKLNELKSATEKSANAKDAMSNVVAYNRKKDVARVKAELEDLLAMLPESEREEVRKEIAELEKGIMEEPEKPVDRPGQQSTDEPKKPEDKQGKTTEGPKGPEPVPGTEQETPDKKETENPEKDTKDGNETKISEAERAIMDKYKEEFGKHIATYISVTMTDVKKAIDFYLKGSFVNIVSPMSKRDGELADHARKLEGREFKANIAKQNLKDAFLDILARAEVELPPEVVQVLKGELNKNLQATLVKEYSETFGKDKKVVDGKTVEGLKDEKGKLLKEQERYETQPEEKRHSQRKEILEKIGKGLAIIEAIQGAQADLLKAKNDLVRDINRNERVRETFRSTFEKPKEGEEQAQNDTPENELVTRFNEVKSTLFNPAVASKIDSKYFKYATGRDNKPILIVHVEFDGTRTADGKVNKQRATVVITENSVRKISEYVATMEPEDYYKSLPESEGIPTDFKEKMDKFLGPQGVDMRPIDKDGKRIEDPKQVPMLSESLVTTKTGMQQLVVNTPKGISAIAVGAKTKSLSYEQKQEIELFTEQQKEIALGVKQDLLDNHKTGLGNKIQNPVAPEGASSISVEAESNLEDFFKIFKTEQESLSVGGTGNFKRDSKGEKIVKQNFMTFVFDKYDKANAEIEDGKDPKPLQFTITERDANGKDTSTTYILGADGKYYDVETVKVATKMADIESKGVEAAVILNRAGTLGIGDKFVSNVIKRDTAKAIAEREEDKKIQEAGLAQYRVDGDKMNRHVNQSELSLHKQAIFEAEQAREAARRAKEKAENGTHEQSDKEDSGRG